MLVTEAWSGGWGFGGPDPPGSHMSSSIQEEHWLLFVNWLRVGMPRARDLKSVPQTECLHPPKFICETLKPDVMAFGGGACGSPIGDPSEVE